MAFLNLKSFFTKFLDFFKNQSEHTLQGIDFYLIILKDNAHRPVLIKSKTSLKKYINYKKLNEKFELKSSFMIYYLCKEKMPNHFCKGSILG